MQRSKLLPRALKLRALAVVFTLTVLATHALSVIAAADAPDAFGVLLMAHGGSPEWNRSVEAAVEPLRSRYKVEVAFGMADAQSIQDGVRRLETQGVRNIGVVRLFVSGESWYDRTLQILGLLPGAPEAPMTAGHAHPDGHHSHGMAFWRVTTRASFALSTQGLGEAAVTGTILAERASALSRTPEREDVLILAHGPADDGENERWIAQINARAEAVRQVRRFRRVQVETLREDWPEKRKPAEARIRSYVKRASDEGGTAIVIPFRIQGFGPYARVLDGLDYVADRTGLLPHVIVTAWIEAQIETLRKGPFLGAVDGAEGRAAEPPGNAIWQRRKFASNTGRVEGTRQDGSRAALEREARPDQ